MTMTSLDDIDDGLNAKKPVQKLALSDIPEPDITAKIKLNSDGLSQALQHLGLRVRLNSRSNRTEWMLPQESDWVDADDMMEAEIRNAIERSCVSGQRDTPAHFGRDRWQYALGAILHNNRVDPFEEWLNGLPDWDHEPRVRQLLQVVFTIDPQYARIAQWCSVAPFLSAIYRAHNPGYKIDEMPVLIGDQGSGKSTFYAWLLPPEWRAHWFADSLNLAADFKTRIEHTQGRVIVECSEMTGSTKGEMTDIKSYLSSQFDVCRLPYRRNPESIPRRFALVGTSNENCLPNDASGNRRFVALPISKGDAYGLSGVELVREYLDANREMLWAEAKYIWMMEDPGAYVPYDLADQQRQVNELFRNSDQTLEESVQTKLSAVSRFESPFQLSDMLSELELTHRDSKRLSVALRNLGYRNRVMRVDGKIKRLWFAVTGEQR